MQLNGVSFLTSAIAGCTGLVLGLVITLNPMVTRAQTTTESLFPAIQQLNLTTEQQSQFEQIRQSTRTQLEAVLTADQQQQFRSTFVQSGTFRQAIAAMNLSADQRSQVREILQSARQQASTVLTPDQRQQLRDLIQERRSERQGQ